MLRAAFSVHTELGAGLLEAVYVESLAEALREEGLLVERQVAVPVRFRGKELRTPLRLDLLVERTVVVEVKAVETLLDVHLAQLQTYLRLSGHELGYLMNFNVPHLRFGIRRLIEA